MAYVWDTLPMGDLSSAGRSDGSWRGGREGSNPKFSFLHDGCEVGRGMRTGREGRAGP